MVTAVCLSKMFVVLSRAYPDSAEKRLGGDGKDALMELYLSLLETVPDEVFEAAVAEHIASSKWFPSISELRGLALDIMITGLGWPSVGEAWEMVVRHIREVPAVGQGKARRKEHPFVERAVASVGGWYTLRRSESPVADRARFMDAYREILEAERKAFEELPIVQVTRDLLASGELFGESDRKLLE